MYCTLLQTIVHTGTFTVLHTIQQLEYCVVCVMSVLWLDRRKRPPGGSFHSWPWSWLAASVWWWSIDRCLLIIVFSCVVFTALGDLWPLRCVCSVVIAEVTQPSLGVGYELGRAVNMKKKIFCLFRPSSGRREAISCLHLCSFPVCETSNRQTILSNLPCDRRSVSNDSGSWGRRLICG